MQNKKGKNMKSYTCEICKNKDEIKQINYMKYNAHKMQK